LHSELPTTKAKKFDIKPLQQLAVKGYLPVRLVCLHSTNTRKTLGLWK